MGGAKQTTGKTHILKRLDSTVIQRFLQVGSIARKTIMAAPRCQTARGDACMTSVSRRTDGRTGECTQASSLTYKTTYT